LYLLSLSLALPHFLSRISVADGRGSSRNPPRASGAVRIQVSRTLVRKSSHRCLFEALRRGVWLGGAPQTERGGVGVGKVMCRATCVLNLSCVTQP